MALQRELEKQWLLLEHAERRCKVSQMILRIGDFRRALDGRPRRYARLRDSQRLLPRPFLVTFLTQLSQCIPALT